MLRRLVIINEDVEGDVVSLTARLCKFNDAGDLLSEEQITAEALPARLTEEFYQSSVPASEPESPLSEALEETGASGAEEEEKPKKKAPAKKK